jgi:hypothetical protein
MNGYSHLRVGKGALFGNRAPWVIGKRQRTAAVQDAVAIFLASSGRHCDGRRPPLDPVSPKNYKVLPLRVHTLACDCAAMIKGGFVCSDFVRPSIDFALPDAVGGSVRSSAVTHRRYSFALPCAAEGRVRSSAVTHRRYNLALSSAAGGSVQRSRLEVQSRKTRTAYFRIKSDKTAYFRLFSPFGGRRGEGRKLQARQAPRSNSESSRPRLWATWREGENGCGPVLPGFARFCPVLPGFLLGGPWQQSAGFEKLGLIECDTLNGKTAIPC